MKGFLITGIIIIAFSFVSIAQKAEFKINAGVNSTFVPDFNNVIYIANDGLVVPGIIAMANSRSTLIGVATKSKTSSKVGYFIQLEANKKVGKRLGLSFSLGIVDVKYNYETTINAPETPYIKLNENTGDYGNPNLFYINLKPISLSYNLFQDKVNLVAGPSLNILINSKYTKTVVTYDNSDVVERVYFEQSSGFNKLLYGIHLKASYKIVKQTELFVDYQYYLNPIYNLNSVYEVGKNSNPKVLGFGASYSF